jgi:RHH-type proline utilization regulon transcriptional repressor/proline dehydrogenase/delta 1-pyrroline-5-carboxylate dehydrogenase
VVRTELDDFPVADLAAIERTTQDVGRQLLRAASARQPNVLERRWWEDRIMSWAMQDESVKVQMFRFIDVLPMLSSSDAILTHLHEYFAEVRQFLPSAARLGLAVATPDSIPGRALAMAARRNAMSHARRFIAGTNADEVLAAAIRQRKQRRAFTLDLLGEAVTSELEAERYLNEYLGLIETIAPVANSWPEAPQVDRSDTGLLPRMNVSVKLSALDSRFDAIDPEGTTRRVGERLRRLLRVARKHRTYVHVDMESYATKDLTLAIFQSILMEDEFRDLADVGIVIQCYLLDAMDDLVKLRDWAAKRGTPVWVRLVKGAYWDYETIHAQATDWPIPVFQEKWQSDACFEQATRFALRNREWLRPALGSHNLRSLAHGIAVARHLGLPTNALETQMLYGMGDAEKDAIVQMGYRMRVYMPFGELIPGMAYLVRRLLENTSNDSFLRASFAETLSPEKLLMNPLDMANSSKTKPPAPAIDAAPKPFAPRFKNEPPADFATAPARDAMSAALATAWRQFGGHYPLVIGGRQIDTAARITSRNPSHKREVVGTTASADASHAAQAVATARAAWPAWASLGAEKRAVFLRAAAAEMRKRRFELSAWIVHETGKGWREADADVCEAIDFCEFYAQQAIFLESEQGVDVPGEENRFVYESRGVTAVIAPWNFPLAILTGMTVAALATGNTVVMKPAEQSPIVAAKLMEIFTAAEFPTGVVNNLPGDGATVGAALVEHPEVAVIVFTGSRPVGLAIHAKAAETSPKSVGGVKKVIAEMGGKNAIIVDDDADLDEAVLGVVQSAFGYQGQKCSACSRAIVLTRIYDVFVERLVEAARSLKIGPAEEPGTNVGPVIDEEAFERIKGYAELGKSEGRVVLAQDVGALAEEGYYIGPQIVADVKPGARLAQEEIFGPVLVVIRAENMDEALRIANGTDYALTGGIFSRSPAHLDRARREFQVGNLYLNRSITGALVNRQPFGGFKMSGIGSKAGGADYLLQFVVPRTITENTMRRGFAPPAE